MLLIDFIKLILADFKKRKFSTFLTFFSISLGILSVFVIILISIGFETSLVKQFEGLGSNRIYISPSGSSFASQTTNKNFTDYDIKTIKNQAYVQKAYPYYIKYIQLKFSNEYVGKKVLGLYMDPQYFKDLNLELDKGRFVKNNERYSLIIGSSAATDLFSKDLQIGSNIYVNQTKFKIVGILKSVGNPNDDNNIYMNIKTLRELTNGGTNVGFADVLIQPNYDVKLAGKNLKIKLERRLGKDSIDISTPDQIISQISSILNIVKYTLGGIAFVALIVGALGIINTMFVIVTEKVNEIGIMKAIGATNLQILFLFTFQAGLFGLIGAILGIILGSFILIIFEKLAGIMGFSFLKLTIDPTITLSLLLFGFLIGIFAGFLPAYKASKINIIEAIRK